MINVLDSCYIKDQIKKQNYSKLKENSIMNFQLMELTSNQVKIFKRLGGRIIFRGPLYTHKDNNFFNLDKKDYCIVTYDKELKRKLKSKGYLVYHSIK